MLIGTWDISEAKARQWNVTPGFHSVSSDSEWPKGSPVPVLFKNEPGFQNLKVVLLIAATGREQILNYCSEILAHLMEPAELTLDGFEHKFYGILTRHSHQENVMKRWHTLTLEFEGYQFGEKVVQTASGVTEILVNNPGNILTPVIVEIVPQSGAASVTLTGICRDNHTLADLPVTVSELETGKSVILDGQTGLITQEGALKSGVTIWSIPTLLPGENKITVDNEWMDITIRFHPYFM